MASCTSIKTFNNIVEDFIKQYEETLSDDTLSDIETNDTQIVLDELYSLRKAVKADDREYISANGFAQQRQDIDQELLEESFRSVLGTSFRYKKGTSNTTSKGDLVNVKLTHGGFRVNFIANGVPKSYNFSLTSDARSQDGKSAKDFIHIPNLRKVLDGYTLASNKQAQLELELGSRDSKLKLSEQYKQDDYVHGSIEQMKAMLSKLHILGGEKASQSELEGYLAVLDKMSPEFFNELDLYLKERASTSKGTVRARRMDIAINPKPKSINSQQSEASIYMEEVVHSMTMSAISAKTPDATKLNRQLDRLLEVARRQISWKDFMPEVSTNKELEKKYADELYKYIFTGENAKYEFIAKAITVPEVAKAFKNINIKEEKDSRGFLERINDIVSFVIDIVRGNVSLKDRSANVHDALFNLAFNFGEINKKANRKLANANNFLTKIFDLLNRLDATTADFVDSIKTKILGDAANKVLGPLPDDLYGKVKWVAQLITYSMVNGSYTKAMGAIATAWGLKPQNSLREIVGGLFATDATQRVAEFLVMQAGYVDNTRNKQIDLVRGSVLSAFKDPKSITLEQEEAMTEVLSDTALADLFGKDSTTKDLDIRKLVYSNSTLRELLTDDATLDKYIRDVKRSLKQLDGNHYTWHRDQAVSLGIYMATHQGTPEQGLNATNIARGIHSSHSKKPIKAVVKAIDELSTLVAIKNTDITSRTVVAELMKEDWKGVQHVADVISGLGKNSDETVFKTDTVNKIKGYSREVFDDTIIMEVAPLEDKEDLEAQGFTFKARLAPRAGDVRNKPMALFVTDTATRPDRLRGGVRLNQITSKGTTITSLAYKDGQEFSSRYIQERAKRDIIRIQKGAIERAKKMEEGTYDFKDTVFGVMPVLNSSGKVTDYRYMMDKKTKKNLLKQDTRISEVMARSYGSVLDKELSEQHNKKALDFLRKDMEENWTSGTKGNDGLIDYTLIGPDVADLEMRKLYYMLPAAMREFVKAREDKTLAVRSDLHQLFFGYSHLTILDFPLLKRFTPQVIQKVIRFAEMMWMEMVKIAKANILIKMPTVLVSNILSNMVQGIMKGYDPITILKLYTESYRDITRYNNDLKRKQELENQLRELKVSGDRDIISEQRAHSIRIEKRRASGELEAITYRLKNSQINELVELGLDQNVEDTTTDVTSDSNRVVRAIDEKLENVPEMVRSGLDIVFITKRTKFYKVANEFLEVSDLVARDVQNRMESAKEQKQITTKAVLPSWWVEKQEEGYNAKKAIFGEERKTFLAEAKERRHYDLVEDFINYTKPSGRMEEYLNRVGILMFTKYVKRIQRIIMKTSGTAPLKTVLGLIAFGFLGGYPSIHEQSFLVKDWYGDSFGPGNVFPVYAPTETLLNVITPSIVKDSTYSL